MTVCRSSCSSAGGPPPGSPPGSVAGRGRGPRGAVLDADLDEAEHAPGVVEVRAGDAEAVAQREDAEVGPGLGDGGHGLSETAPRSRRCGPAKARASAQAPRGCRPRGRAPRRREAGVVAVARGGETRPNRRRARCWTGRAPPALASSEGRRSQPAMRTRASAWRRRAAAARGRCLEARASATRRSSSAERKPCHQAASGQPARRPVGLGEARGGRQGGRDGGGAGGAGEEVPPGGSRQGQRTRVIGAPSIPVGSSASLSRRRRGARDPERRRVGASLHPTYGMLAGRRVSPASLIRPRAPRPGRAWRPCALAYSRR